MTESLGWTIVGIYALLLVFTLGFLLGVAATRRAATPTSEEDRR